MSKRWRTPCGCYLRRAGEQISEFFVMVETVKRCAPHEEAERLAVQKDIRG